MARKYGASRRPRRPAGGGGGSSGELVALVNCPGALRATADSRAAGAGPERLRCRDLLAYSAAGDLHALRGQQSVQRAPLVSLSDSEIMAFLVMLRRQCSGGSQTRLQRRHEYVAKVVTSLTSKQSLQLFLHVDKRGTYKLHSPSMPVTLNCLPPLPQAVQLHNVSIRC